MKTAVFAAEEEGCEHDHLMVLRRYLESLYAILRLAPLPFGGAAMMASARRISLRMRLQQTGMRFIGPG